MLCNQNFQMYCIEYVQFLRVSRVGKCLRSHTVYTLPPNWKNVDESCLVFVDNCDLVTNSLASVRQFCLPTHTCIMTVFTNLNVDNCIIKQRSKIKQRTEQLERGLSEIIDGPLGVGGSGEKQRSRHVPGK